MVMYQPRSCGAKFHFWNFDIHRFPKKVLTFGLSAMYFAMGSTNSDEEVVFEDRGLSGSTHGVWTRCESEGAFE